MKRFFCVLALLAFACAASATTYFVRTDGGTAAQCTGVADAAYPGGGSAQACAWQHPFIALPPGALGDHVAPLIRGGDTLIIDSGSYMMGYGAPGAASCSVDFPWDCHISNIPSGLSASRPTTIRGAMCNARPQLWGTQRTDELFDVEHASNVSLRCLDLTDHSNCIVFHIDPKLACQRDAYPYGDWAANGIMAYADTNLSLYGLNIHGFARDGVNIGAINGLTLNHVVLRGNGWAGFDGDTSSRGGSSNAGTTLIENSRVVWNGCTENYPATTIIGCWAQQEGGYGDGLGTGSTGGAWRVIHSAFLDNTSDGLDLLYMDGTGSVFVDRVTSEFNLGNQLKIAGTSTVQNSVIDGDCSSMMGRNNISAGDLCRAQGNAVSASFAGPMETFTFNHNSVTGDGDCLLIAGGAMSQTDTADISNGVFIGGPDFTQAGDTTCFTYFGDGPPQVSIIYNDNAVFDVKNGACPPGSLCVDPKLTNETLKAFDAMPLPGSPVLGAGSDCPTYDWSGALRPVPCSIGALDQ